MIQRYVPDEDSGAFGPDEIGILNDALAEAWQRVLAAGAQFNGQETVAREKLARLLIELAKGGDLDQGRLVEDALIRFRL